MSKGNPSVTSGFSAIEPSDGITELTRGIAVKSPWHEIADGQKLQSGIKVVHAHCTTWLSSASVLHRAQTQLTLG
jgi:hypothetical protein